MTVPSWPSKGPPTYQTPGRWEDGRAPEWLTRLGKGSAMPYRFVLIAATVGLLAGGALEALAGWDALRTAAVVVVVVLTRLALGRWWRVVATQQPPKRRLS